VSGTVNIARTLFQDEAFKDQPFTEREAFMWMVMEASWKDRTKRVGAIVVDLKRGQLAASIRFMAEAWQWEKSTVDRFLKRLEKRDMIGTASGTGVNVITICKYADYQGGETESGTEKNEKRDSSGTAAGQTRTPEVIPEVVTEANASDGDAVDPAKALWDAGVKLLSGTGMTTKAARSVIGGLRKDFPGQDGQILSAIMECGRAGAVDPIPWLKAKLKPKSQARMFDLSNFGMTQ
jgi:predicted transcriptional regulator